MTPPPSIVPEKESAKPPQIKFPEMPWHARLNVLNVTLLLFLLAVIFSSGTLAGSGRSISYIDRLANFSTRLCRFPAG